MKTKPLPIAIVLALASSTLGHSAPETPKFTVHEWGTFTSVSTSDGRLLPGVEAEEEPLPGFVHSLEGMSNLNVNPFAVTKGWRRPLANVTVRMETPVLYFYTEQPFRAQVDVGFQGGSISQWYPDRSGGENLPSIKTIDADKIPVLDFGTPYQGSIQWKVDVFPAPEDAFGRVFKPHESPAWLYPRHTDSALVRTDSGETEKYLFYRGVGNMASQYRFQADQGGAVRISPIDCAGWRPSLVFQNEGGKARWLTASWTAPAELGKEEWKTDWRRGVYEEMAGMLTGAGLFRKEADAMLQTWWTSYFEREGTRVFWIASPDYTSRILPLKIEPAPEKTVRVMVGRTEILTPEFESRLVTDFTTAEQAGQPEPWGGDRFFRAYSKRVKELRSSAAKR